jgi:hypothetical protein
MRPAAVATCAGRPDPAVASAWPAYPCAPPAQIPRAALARERNDPQPLSAPGDRELPTRSARGRSDPVLPRMYTGDRSTGPTAARHPPRRAPTSGPTERLGVPTCRDRHQLLARPSTRPRPGSERTPLLGSGALEDVGSAHRRVPAFAPLPAERPLAYAFHLRNLCLLPSSREMLSGFVVNRTGRAAGSSGLLPGRASLKAIVPPTTSRIPPSASASVASFAHGGMTYHRSHTSGTGGCRPGAPTYPFSPPRIASGGPRSPAPPVTMTSRGRARRRSHRCPSAHA